MSLFNPETIFLFKIQDEKSNVSSYLVREFVGSNSFKIETMFGAKEANYYGEFDYDQMNIVRRIDSLNKIPIYPTGKINLQSEGTQSIIRVRCSLSTSWAVFLYFIYIMIIVVAIISWFYSETNFSRMILVLKMLGAFFCISAIVYGYHFSEVKNLKKIFSSVIDKYVSVPAG